MNENIATLEECLKCKGVGALPAVISIDGGFTPGIVCPRCNGRRYIVVGGCCCEGEDCGDEEPEEREIDFPL